MSRYTVRQSGWIEDEHFTGDVPREPLSVDGPKEVDTGILTASGDRIYRIQPPIGFGRDDEW